MLMWVLIVVGALIAVAVIGFLVVDSQMKRAMKGVSEDLQRKLENDPEGLVTEIIEADLDHYFRELLTARGVAGGPNVQDAVIAGLRPRFDKLLALNGGNLSVTKAEFRRVYLS
jgi:hypothetical protein